MQLQGTRGAGLILAVLSAALFVLPAGARADFGIETWEAGTCNSDTPECSYTSPEPQLFTQAAGHPGFHIASFSFNTVPGPSPGEATPDGLVRDIKVDLPPGFSVNPQAVPRCTEAELETPQADDGRSGIDICEAKGAKVGIVTLVVANGSLQIHAPVPVFNLVPKPGEPAEFGFRILILGIDVTTYLDGTVSWEGDYHEGVTIRQVEHAFPVLSGRLALDTSLGDGSFLTAGSNCEGSTTSAITVDSYKDPTRRLTYQTTPFGPARVIRPSGCGAVPFDPSLQVGPSTSQVDSPTGLSVKALVPIDSSAPIAQANLKRAIVTLPPGMGLNPGFSSGIRSCTDAEFGQGIAIGDRITNPTTVHPPPLGCPFWSEIGTVAIETPVLPPGSLSGKLYLGQQMSRDPGSGKEYRVFLDAESPQLGVYVRLTGEIAADPKTGRLTATFDEPAAGGLPQVPLSSISLTFDEAKGLLTTPPTCGDQVTTSRLSPWSGRADATPSAGFTLNSSPAGSNCATEAAKRPFSPSFSASVDDPGAAAFSPLRLTIGRSDGQQELKGIDLTLPPGETAKLAGIATCSPAEIAAAAAHSGSAETSQPSCPAGSRIGVAKVAAGSGPSPLQLKGKVYLAGPDAGAKLSLAVIVPALAGPFDLGTAVVQAPLKLDLETAQIHPSATIPDVFGGAKLDIRSLSLDLDRPQFTLNGTSCGAAAASGTLLGGGADPTNPATFSPLAVSAPFQVQGCSALKFGPRLDLRLAGAARRGGHPKLGVLLESPPGDANIATASVALPHALFLDQASLGRICTRVQFAVHGCPPASIYGFAKASTPLLDRPLEGPVYLRSSEHALPDLVAHLEGQIDIDLVGHIDSFKGGIRTTFDRVPDVPVSNFSLSLPGGKHGLLVASTNLCARPVRAIVRLKGQNGRKASGTQRVRVRCAKGRKGRA